jgi:phenylpyruvate tautomerase PptA (4-oxalocrotonate tautomerase family)
MPFLKLSTNKQLSKDKKQQLLRDMTALLSKDLNKPEKYIMVDCEDNKDMIFAGIEDLLVFIELRSIRLPEDKTGELSKSLSNFVKNNLQISPDRIFINFFNIQPHMWGFNASTF